MNRLFSQQDWSTAIQMDGCVYLPGKNQRQSKLRFSKLLYAAVFASLCMHTLVIFSMSNLTSPPPALEISPFYFYTAYLTNPEPDPSTIAPPVDRILPVPPDNAKVAAPATTFPDSAESVNPQSPPDQSLLTPPVAISPLPPPVKKLIAVSRKVPQIPDKKSEPRAVTAHNRPSDGGPVQSEKTPAPASQKNTATSSEAKAQSGDEVGNRKNLREIQQFLTANIDDIGGKVMAVLQYPAIARRMKWQGLSSIGFVLHPSGEVTDFTVEKSSGHEILDKHAIAAVKAAAPFSGAPGKVAVILPIRFHLY